MLEVYSFQWIRINHNLNLVLKVVTSCSIRRYRFVLIYVRGFSLQKNRYYTMINATIRLY